MKFIVNNNRTMNESIYFNGKRISEILAIPTQLRGDLLSLELADLTYAVSFLSKLREKHSDELHKQCCKYMTLEMFSKNQYIYEIGDPGNKYYILLKGKVSLAKYITAENIDSDESIDSEGDEYSDTSPKNIRSRTRKIDIKPEVFLEFSQEIKERKQPELISISILEDENKKLLDFIMQSHEVDENEKEIRLIFPGKDFGQEGLFRSKTRTLNAVAKSKVKVGVLTKMNFKKIINDISKQRSLMMLDFLKSISIFSR